MSVTLADIERETARRVGPYAAAFSDRQSPNTASFNFVLFPELRSSIDLDSVTNLWMLRRGVDWQGNPVTFDVVDRQRLVASYETESGRLEPDRPWGTIPARGEVFEFHHLDPQQELRTAVLAGLRRCFTQDRGLIYPNLEAGQYDLTAIQAWITSPSQVLRLQAGMYMTGDDIPFQTAMQGGHVLLVGQTPASPGGAWLTALRPVVSWVNGAESTTGPTQDADQLDVDLDYAASAAHIEAWHLFPSRLQSAAAGGTQATQPMAATEFTRQSLIWGPKRSREIRFSEVVRLY